MHLQTMYDSRNYPDSYGCYSNQFWSKSIKIYLSSDSCSMLKSSSPVKFQEFTDIFCLNSIIMSISTLNPHIKGIFSPILVTPSKQNTILNQFGNRRFVNREEIEPPSSIFPFSFLTSLTMEKQIIFLVIDHIPSYLYSYLTLIP